MASQDKFSLTKEGKTKIEEELKELLKLKSFKTRGESPRIFHSEDINPEFLAYQEDLDLLGVRIVELQAILKNSQLIVPPPKDKQDIVGLGAAVIIEVNGEEDEFQVVGTLEANPSLGRISNESPVGKALLGHKTGDEIKIQSPIVTIYRIKKVTYPRS